MVDVDVVLAIVESKRLGPRTRKANIAHSRV